MPANQALRISLLVLLVYVATADSRPQEARIAAITFRGDFPEKESELIRQSGLRKNGRLSAENLRRAAGSLEAHLMDRGYLYARIDSISTDYSDDSLRVTLTIHGKAGNPVYFGDVDIRSDSLHSDLYRQRLTFRSGDRYARARLEEGIREMLSLAADSGFLHAEARVEDLGIGQSGNRNQADIALTVHENERVRIDEIRFRGNTYTRRHVLLRELPLKPGAPYSRKEVERIPDRLNRLGLLKAVSQPAIVLKNRRTVSLLIDVEEGNSTTFDGVVGYIPGATVSEEGFFSGLVDLSLSNLFGTGRRFSVYWKKPDRFSEEFSLNYNEPWVLGYPVDAGLGLERVVRDTTFIEWQYELNSRMRVRDNLYLVSRVHRRIALPDSASSRRERITRNAVLNGEIGIEYDSRDYPVNPRMGIFYRNTYSYGLKENFGPSYLLNEQGIRKNERLETIRIDFRCFQRLTFNQVVALQMKGFKVSGSRLQLTDFFWFGGSRSLRGYRENQFRGNEVAWANLEYRFLLGRNSRLFLFNDWGFYRNIRREVDTDEILPGYGIGIRLDTGLGIMGIDYGLGRGDSFSQGKIHFGIVNRF